MKHLSLLNQQQPQWGQATCPPWVRSGGVSAIARLIYACTPVPRYVDGFEIFSICGCCILDSFDAYSEVMFLEGR